MIVRRTSRKAIFFGLLLLIRVRLLDFGSCLVLFLFLLVLGLFSWLLGRLSRLWLILLGGRFLIFGLRLEHGLWLEHLRSLLERDGIVDDLAIDSPGRAASASAARATSATATRFAAAA